MSVTRWRAPSQGRARASSSWEENPKSVATIAAASDDLPDSLGPTMRLSRRGSRTASYPTMGPKPSMWIRSNRMAWVLELGEPDPERERRDLLFLLGLRPREPLQRAPHERATDRGLVAKSTQERRVQEVGMVVDFQVKETVPDPGGNALGFEHKIGRALEAHPDDFTVPGEGGDPVDQLVLVMHVGPHELDRDLGEGARVPGLALDRDRAAAQGHDEEVARAVLAEFPALERSRVYRHRAPLAHFDEVVIVAES